MFLNYVILALCWVIYCLLHSLLASVAVKKKLQLTLGSAYRYYRLFYTLLAFFFLVVLIWFQLRLPRSLLFKGNVLTVAAGILLALPGLALMAVCIRKYFVGLSGILSIVKERAGQQMLLTTGVHRHVRHPLYLGTLCMLWGGFLLYPDLSLLITNVIITVYTFAGMRLEEQKLVQEFGDSYREYQKNVPMIFPVRKANNRFG